MVFFLSFPYTIPVSSCGRRTSPDPPSNAQCHQQQQQDLFSRIYGVNPPTPGAYHPGPTPSSPKHPLFMRNNSESENHLTLNYSLVYVGINREVHERDGGTHRSD